MSFSAGMTAFQHTDARRALLNDLALSEGRYALYCEGTFMGMRTMDLNLLKVFEALMLHRNVAAAAKELEVTPSAVSHALSRLRKIMDDEVFIAGSSGMQPTPLAIEVGPHIREGMRSLFSVLERKPFNAETSERTFHIGASEYTTTAIISPLVVKLATAAPQMSFRVFPAGRMDCVRSLDEGSLDCVLGWFGEIPSRLRRATIFIEEEAIVVRKGHPLTNEVFGKQRLLEFDHIVVELTGSEATAEAGFIKEREVMRRNWIECVLVDNEDEPNSGLGRVAVTLPYYSSVIPIVKGTDMVATLPLSVAQRLAIYEPIEILPLPYKPFQVPVEALWHERSDLDIPLNWLIKTAQTRF